MTENGFLKKLLTLQQDGSAAISAPRTWGLEPLLQIRTDLDDVVDQLAQDIVDGVQNYEIARWHFFVGSPGNGKSAGTGGLARRLEAAGFAVRDADGNELASIPPETIPYKLEVFEPGQRFACAFIAQDASVVPNPYAEDANPATALVDLLKEASEKGISLLVCTNRGVLERAFAAHYLDKTCRDTIWFRTIRVAVLGKKEFSGDFDDSRRKTCKSMSFRYTNLDRRSLLVGRPTFEHLVEKAIARESWSVCETCAVHNRCPFYQNARWLAEPNARASFIKLVQYAEVLSGQVIVFREALALLSLLLAGCPHDYKDGSPCNWVHEKVSGEKYFSLLSRRIYMTLFSAHSPFGLESFEDDRIAQQDLIKDLAESTRGDGAPQCRSAISEVVARTPSISADVGIERLVGGRGIFQTMDCSRDILPAVFYERWDDSGQSPFDDPTELFSVLDRECAQIWATLRDAAESRGDVAGAAYRWLSRWTTAFTHRAGALLTGSFTFANDIEGLVRILSIEDPDDEEGLRLIEQVEEDLWHMLHAGGEGTQISAFALLKGEWVKTKLRPHVDRPGDNDGQSIVLNLNFGENTQVPLSALAFAWLKRRGDRAMSAEIFPLQYLESARDALVKAASESHYHTQDNYVELVVTLPPPVGRKVSLKRTRGRVIVDGL